jgi:hypothetical protein
MANAIRVKVASVAEMRRDSGMTPMRPNMRKAAPRNNARIGSMSFIIHLTRRAKAEACLGCSRLVFGYSNLTRLYLTEARRGVDSIANKSNIHLP